MKNKFHQQAAINTFAIFTLLWVLVVGYIKIIQNGEISFLGTVVYFDFVLVTAIFAGFIYEKKENKNAKPVY